MENTQIMRNLQLTPKRRKKEGFLREVIKNKVLFIMMLPLLLAMFFNNYLPMLGSAIAFKDLQTYRSSFIYNYIHSPWVGINNFKYLFQTPDALTFTRNTILYNLLFIALGLVVSVAVAIALNEMRNGLLSKVYQTTLFLPYFLSWVVVSYLVFAFLSEDVGMMNRSILPALGMQPVSWYAEPKYWPFILTIAQMWKYTGYNCVVYLAAIAGIDTEFYEAAKIDGANKWQQIRKITLPLLTPLMVILCLLAVGKIFNSDFGLFFQIPRNSGILYDTTQTIDTYVYNTLQNTGDVGMAAAASFYQSIVGFVCVIATNFVVRKLDPEKALF